jgi:nucleoside-diphosphate-sugar epimerase
MDGELGMAGKVLLTGATGFTGRALCERLVAGGEQVVVFARPSSNVESLRALGVEIRVLEMTDAAAVAAAFEPFDRIFHIAAAFRTEHDHIDEFRQANVTVTQRLMDAAMRAKCGRFVHCSTVGVQGEIDDPPADETYRYKPGDNYQQTKMEGEQLVLDYIRRGLPCSIVRPVGIYGPGDRRFLKLFKPIRHGRFVMIGNGSSLYHLTYIDDLVDGFLLASRHPAALGEIFTIGGARYTTLREMVNAIADSLEVPHPRLSIPYWPVAAAAHIVPVFCRPLRISPPIYPRRVEFFKKSRAFSIEKARRLLGYSPKVSLEEGLRLTGEWYRREGWI